MIVAIGIYCLLGLMMGFVTVTIHQSLRGGSRSLNIYHYSFSLVTALQFMLIALQVISSANIALLCLLAVCANFLVLNEMEEVHYWENNVHLAIIAIAVIHVFVNLHPFILMTIVYYPIIVLVVALVVKVGAKLFIGMDVLKSAEIRIMSLCSVMLASSLPSALSSYILLVAGLVFVWALYWKVAKKKQEMSLVPAIVFALLLCRIFPKLIMITEHML